MGAFDYTALDHRGKERKGVLEADSPRHARQQLREKSLVPLRVDAAAGKLRREQSGGRLAGKLSHRDLATVTRQLAALVQAALPIDEALAAVIRQAESSRVRRIFSTVRAKVREGHSLAEALGQFPGSFSRLYLATVAAGEESGHLDLVLEQLADYADANREFRQKVQLAMIYPLLLLVLSVLIVAGLMVYVVPDVIAVFTGTGQPLPMLTRGLVALSDFLRQWGWLLLLALLLLVGVTGWGIKQPAIRLQWHRRLLHMPLLKRLTRGANAARYASTLSILVKSGVPLLSAMKIATEVVVNDFLRKKLEEAGTRVTEGGSLSTALESTGYFPPIMVHMIASGETSGRLDEMLGRTARQQQQDLQTLVVAVVGLFEPLMLILMGVVVLLIVLAILLPILNLNQIVA